MPRIPEGLDTASGVDATQCHHGSGSFLGPEHARLFAALCDHAAASRFNHSRTDEPAVFAERAILHALDVVLEVTELRFHGFFPAGAGGLIASLADDTPDTVGKQHLAPVVAPPGKTPRIVSGQQGFNEVFQVFQGVVVVDDLDGMREVALPHFFQAKRPVDQEYHLACSAHATPDGFMAQTDAETRGAFKSGQIGGGLMVAHRAAMAIELVLGKHAPERGHACPGFAVGGFAFAAFEFFASHGHSGVVRLDVKDLRVAGLGWAFTARPLGGIFAHTQDFTLDLPLLHINAADFEQMKRGFLVAGLIGAFEAYEAGEGGGVVAFQPESFVGGMMALFFSGMVEVGAQQGGTAEDALDLKGLAAFPDFSGFGLVGVVDFVGGLLQKFPDEFGRGLENGGAKQFFEIRDESSARLGIAERCAQFLDFLLAGEVEGFVIRRFFLTLDLRSFLEISAISATCSSTNALKC